MSMTGTASPPPGIKKSMLQRGLQDSVCVASTSLSMSLYTQFFTLRQISHIWPLSLMHKTHWDTGPWHLLFPGPPALSRVFLKVLFVYRWYLSAKGRWEGPSRSKAVTESPSSEPLISTCPLESFAGSPPVPASLQLFIKTSAYLICLHGLWSATAAPARRQASQEASVSASGSSSCQTSALVTVCTAHNMAPP